MAPTESTLHLGEPEAVPVWLRRPTVLGDGPRHVRLERVVKTLHRVEDSMQFDQRPRSLGRRSWRIITSRSSRLIIGASVQIGQGPPGIGGRLKRGASSQYSAIRSECTPTSVLFGARQAQRRSKQRFRPRRRQPDQPDLRRSARSAKQAGRSPTPAPRPPGNATSRRTRPPRRSAYTPAPKQRISHTALNHRPRQSNPWLVANASSCRPPEPRRYPNTLAPRTAAPRCKPRRRSVAIPATSATTEQDVYAPAGPARPGT